MQRNSDSPIATSMPARASVWPRRVRNTLCRFLITIFGVVAALIGTLVLSCADKDGTLAARP
jgi:hypothetical protein